MPSAAVAAATALTPGGAVGPTAPVPPAAVTAFSAGAAAAAAEQLLPPHPDLQRVEPHRILTAPDRFLSSSFGSALDVGRDLVRQAGSEALHPCGPHGAPAAPEAAGGAYPLYATPPLYTARYPHPHPYGQTYYHPRHHHHHQVQLREPCIGNASGWDCYSHSLSFAIRDPCQAATGRGGSGGGGSGSSSWVKTLWATGRQHTQAGGWPVEPEPAPDGATAAAAAADDPGNSPNAKPDGGDDRDPFGAPYLQQLPSAAAAAVALPAGAAASFPSAGCSASSAVATGYCPQYCSWCCDFSHAPHPHLCPMRPSPSRRIAEGGGVTGGEGHLLRTGSTGSSSLQGLQTVPRVAWASYPFPYRYPCPYPIAGPPYPPYRYHHLYAYNGPYGCKYDGNYGYDGQGYGHEYPYGTRQHPYMYGGGEGCNQPTSKCTSTSSSGKAVTSSTAHRRRRRAPGAAAWGPGNRIILAYSPSPWPRAVPPFVLPSRGNVAAAAGVPIRTHARWRQCFATICPYDCGRT
ncbi:hypothetical protein VOLCADRAFT_103119 [Volvox carteri f. nagariensis]|uniref:Uncharacterized protein n=1 Tax=Volvox carteri f. nagariensis TaxID=3068 RepID=D8TKR4_VOLCA|nr:uncharacterized protein VOLCADRAFT_103119 [Volvox carteri f. nagariensis]EFJ52108.1 hypothetical protein VOLCADRAFT_103119 [Volvox carteri f. nagariensis]|eukprot:XP_002946882.1 hypothetical protein VOLCADRAFT_103119 [Volvox carteri f. nagariensis]